MTNKRSVELVIAGITAVYDLRHVFASFTNHNILLKCGPVRILNTLNTFLRKNTRLFAPLGAVWVFCFFADRSGTKHNIVIFPPGSALDLQVFSKDEGDL